MRAVRQAPASPIYPSSPAGVPSTPLCRSPGLGRDSTLRHFSPVRAVTRLSSALQSASLNQLQYPSSNSGVPLNEAGPSPREALRVLKGRKVPRRPCLPSLEAPGDAFKEQGHRASPEMSNAGALGTACSIPFVLTRRRQKPKRSQRVSGVALRSRGRAGLVRRTLASASSFTRQNLTWEPGEEAQVCRPRARCAGQGSERTLDLPHPHGITPESPFHPALQGC